MALNELNGNAFPAPYTYTPFGLVALASAVSGGLLTPELVKPEDVAE